MSPFQKWLVLSSAIVGTVTGLVLGWMKYLMQPTDPWAVINHPLEPWVLKAHILAVPVLVFAVGMVAVDHIWKHYRAGVRSGRRRLGVGCHCESGVPFLIGAGRRSRLADLADLDHGHWRDLLATRW